MKYKKIGLNILIAVTICSCNKNKLDQPALGALDETTLENKSGVEGLLIGAYSMLDGISGIQFNYGAAGSNWVYGSICGSEAYKGGLDVTDQADISSLETFDPNAYNSDLAEKWTAVYDGVARTNDVLRVMRLAKDMSTADTTEVRAEALFLRAFYHFEAKKIWNDIPYVDESITVGAGNYHVPNDTSWSHIEDDLLYAMNKLPAIQDPVAPGRANKYAAEALLAKAYMFEKKYPQALPLLNDLIQNGVTSSGVKYALYKRYHDNFDPAYKNGSESVFAAQISVNEDGVPNIGDFLNYPIYFGDNGFFQPSQYLVNHFKTDATTGLPDLDNFNVVNVKNDEGLKSTDPFTPDTVKLDPRLDWTVGRRGIPYLDWGNHAGNDWIRNQAFGGPYSPKKNSIAQSEGELYINPAWGDPRANANNINLIRFADVLLWAAEAEVESGGSLDTAEDYVNMIRNRAANPDGWVHTYIDTNDPSKGFTNIPAANYFIKPYPDGYFQSHGQDYARKAVRYERMLELGMEGHRFFDLVRWGVADTEINSYLQKEKTLRDYLNDAKFTKNKNEYFPIPQTQIDLSAGADGKPQMIQNSGY